MTTNPRRHPLTLKDLAHHLGISRTTASNAFNRPDQLSGELRERILETARELGYPGPNPMARKLRTGRAGSIGLLFSEPLPFAFADPTAIALLQGVAQVCERYQSGLLLIPVVDAAQGAKLVAEAAVDGFLIYCLPEVSPVVPQALERGLPVVAVDQRGIEDISSVGIDEGLAARQAAEHLLALGHRRIAVLSLDLRDDLHAGQLTPERRQRAEYHTTLARLESYEATLQAAGVDTAGLVILECPNNSEEHARRLSRELLAGPARPTAILAMSDRLALGALQAAGDLGIPVPQALSVVGFDDIPLAIQIRPALTTIHQPLVEKGVIAAELLLEPPARPRHRLLPTELVVRDSTGPVPADIPN